MEKDQFSIELKKVASRVEQLEENLKTEEATKTSLIMPFFQCLGYDVFNPLEFIPEYVADVGIKKGEKVDYAIVIDKELQILVEAKAVTEPLSNHDSQLFRYFGTTTAKIGILTNGKEYRFYTDLDETNKMDSKPFMIVDITNLRDNQISELFKYTKENFNLDKISSTASELKYTTQLKEYLNKELASPSDEFAKFIVGNIYEGRKTEQIVSKFKPIISKGFSSLINEIVSDKLSSALNTSVSEKVIPSNGDNTIEAEVTEDNNGIVTTDDEMEAYTTAKIILRDTLDPDRIYYRDNRSYFNVLIDDSRLKWVFRVHFTSARNYIILNDEENTELIFAQPIDIYQYSEQIKAVAETLI